MAAAFPVQEIVIIAVVVLVVTMILFWPEKQTCVFVYIIASNRHHIFVCVAAVIDNMNNF